jgi:predicted metal-dependent peptidase
MKLNIRGGGGTSHKDIFNKIDNKTKWAIFLTDGESDLQEIDFHNYGFRKLFLISEGGTDEQLKGKDCQIIKLEKQ